MAEFETRVRTLLETIDESGATPGTMGEALDLLSSVLENYKEIDTSCRQMISGLREVDGHMDKIEDGRLKIMDGVEKILGHLNQLDTLARQTLDGSGVSVPAEVKDAKSKRILLIRVRPQPAQQKDTGDVKISHDMDRDVDHDADDALEGELDPEDGQDTTIH